MPENDQLTSALLSISAFQGLLKLVGVFAFRLRRYLEAQHSDINASGSTLLSRKETCWRVLEFFCLCLLVGLYAYMLEQDVLKFCPARVLNP